MRSIAVHKVLYVNLISVSSLISYTLIKMKLEEPFILKYVGIGFQIMYKVVSFPLDVK
jgi:hypothetical protein